MSYRKISRAVLYKRMYSKERGVNCLKETKNFNHGSDNFCHSYESQSITVFDMNLLCIPAVAPNV